MQYKIIVDKQSRTNPSSNKKEYLIDIEELRTNGNVSDSLIIKQDETYVIRRLKLSEYHVLEELGAEKKEVISNLKIELFEGDNYIYLIDMVGNKFYAEYLIKNDFNDTFVSQNEMNSAINQSAKEIELTVNQKLTGYSTTEQMNSAITIKANEISSNVSKTYETKENATKQYSNIKQTTDSITSEVGKKVGNSEIISKINQSAETVRINAEKIELTANDVLNLLAGNEINLSSKTISIKSNVLNITSDGAIRMYLPNDGYVAIQLTDQRTNLTSVLTASQFFFGDVCSGGKDVQGEGFINVKGEITCQKLTQTSLVEHKKNFEKMQDNALEVIKNIDIYKYNLKNEKDTDKKHLGFVIGNNYNYSKEVTSIDNTGVDTYSFVSLCCKAIQEQQKQIEELKQRIENLEKGEKNGNT